jgi:2'-5' RNA ligase
MRLFLAIDIPNKEKKLIEEQISKIKNEYPQFDWVPSDNYHITIHFFGEIEHIERLKKRLEECLFDQESFYLYSYSVDLFINHKIVIYLDFRREKKLEQIEKRIRETFQPQKKNTEKFVPHLTLARCRIPSKQQYFVLKKRIHKLNVDVSFETKKLVLFQSILGGRIPEYKIIKKLPLL